MSRRFSLLLTALCLAPVALAQPPAELKGHTGLVYSIAFSPDGKTLATASFDETIKLWSFPEGKELQTLKGHTKAVYCVAFNHDGTMLASSGQDKTIRLWDAKSGKFLRELKGHGDTVSTVAFSGDGKYLASGGADKTVRLWDPQAGKEVKNLGAHKKAVYSVAFNGDGKYLASAGEDTAIKVWDVPGLKEFKSLTARGNIDAFTTVLFLPGGHRLLSAGFDKYLREWNVAEGKESKKALPISGASTVGLLGSALGRGPLLAASALPPGKSAEVKKLGPAANYLYGIALSRDGKSIATVGYGGTLNTWDLDTGKATWTYQLREKKGRPRICYCLAFTPDGTAIAVGSEADNAVYFTPVGKK
jgi:WD40 repeat protein